MEKKYLSADEIRRCIKEDTINLRQKVLDLRKKNRRLERSNVRRKKMSFYFEHLV